MNDNAKALYEDLLRSRIEHFGMRDWCGSVQCIGGTAEMRMILCGASSVPIGEASDSAIADWLGVDIHISRRLFFPGGTVDERSPWYFGRFKENPGTEDPFDATQREAAEALKRACELSERAQ